jgi:membrane-associated phospholipid phosphatase
MAQGSRIAAVGCLVTWLFSSPVQASGPLNPAQAQGTPSQPGIGSELPSDLHYLVNNLVQDGADGVHAPLNTGELLRDPRFYWGALGTAAALGTAFALDRPLRSAARHMRSSTASGLRGGGIFALGGAAGLLYAYGLGTGDVRAREAVLTTAEAAGVGALLTFATKVVFGRARPNAGEGPWSWGGSGRSFVSGDAMPAFVLATGLSDYWDNRWYVLVPSYGAAATVGLGRMGADAHWFSDIVGSALLGVGTTKLLLYLHRKHAADPTRYRVFPVVSRGGIALFVSCTWGASAQSPARTSRAAAPAPVNP